MPCPSTSTRAPNASGTLVRTARLAARSLGALAFCLVACVSVNARALPRFPSAEVVPMPTEFPGNDYKGHIADPFSERLVDLDGDGDLDIVATVRVFSPNYLVTWFNRGSGDFTLGESLAYPSFVNEFVETADIDLDGDIDVAVSNGRLTQVWLNDGSGKLVQAGANFHAEPFSFADLNRDGFPDLLTVDSSNLPSSDNTPEPVVIYLSNHDGTFGLPPKPGTGTSRQPNLLLPLPAFALATSVPIARDFNGDGLVDLVIEDGQGGRLLYYEGNGILSWDNPPKTLVAGYSPGALAVSDIDLDGDLDLLTVDEVYGAIVILKNDNGEFSAPVLALSLYTLSLSLADLNNDCFPDIFSSNGVYLSVMFNRGDGTFAEPINYSMGGVFSAVEAGDIDGDGDLDFVACSGPSDNVPKPSGFLTVARNLGTGEFWAPKAYDIAARNDAFGGGDFNGDKRADFAVGSGVLLGSSRGGYEPFRTIDNAPPCDLCGAEVIDLNADGFADVLQERYDSTVRAFISQGDGSFKQSWSANQSAAYLSVGHLNKDKLWDFVAQQNSTMDAEYLGATATTFGPGPSVTWSFVDMSGVFLPKLADLNADGADELLTLNYGSNGLGVGVNNGDGTTFASKRNYLVGAVPRGFDVADYTGDGKPDAVVSADSGSVVLFPGKGDGTFNASHAYPARPLPGHVASGDFDRDGDIDLIVSSSDPIAYSVTYLENAGKGVFSSPVELMDANGPTKLVTTDLEGDGDPDFAVINSGAQTLSTFENRPLTEDPAKSHPPVCDRCPKDAAKTVPGVCGCGVGDADADADGVLDCKDACPRDATKTNAGICGCGVSDRDTDADGKADCNDACPKDPLKIVAGVCGCGVVDVDTDGDGTVDCNDACPLDTEKVAAGTCGCGVAESDSDGDKALDCVDGCPTDAAKISPGLCGCGAVDDDADRDATPDCNDGCPLDPLKARAGACGCGTADTDTDGDGWPDCVDECPSTPGTCAASGGESTLGSAGTGGHGSTDSGSGGAAGAHVNEQDQAGASSASEPDTSGGGDAPLSSAGSASGSGGTPEPTFERPTGTQIPPEKPAEGCACSTPSKPRTSTLGLLPVGLLIVAERRRARRKARLPSGRVAAG